MSKKLDVLLSTCKMKDIKQLNLKAKNLRSDVVIVNQMMEKDKLYERDGVSIYDTAEKGISKSRNKLIELSDADFCIVTDDDISFKKDYQEILLSAYETYPDADIICFSLKKGDDIYGIKKSKKLNYLDLFRVFAVQISFKRESINDINLKYDENFGIGSSIINIGEENIFLTDAYKKGLKIYQIPDILVEHPDEPTTGEFWSKEVVIDKGAVAKRTLGIFAFMLLTYMLLTKRKFYKKEMSSFEFFKHYRLGFKKYNKIRKRKK